MRKLNVLHIITKLELGGAQKNALYILANLDRARYNKYLITSPGGLLQQEARSIPELNFQILFNFRHTINPIADLVTLFLLTRYIRNKKIDIVHTHSSKAGILGRWAARFAGAKAIIHTVHGWSFNDYQSPLWRKIIIWLERLTALITDKFIVVSYHDRQKGLDNLIGNEDKYRLIRYGIDYEEFNKKDGSIRQELGIGASDLLVGMTSCFKPQKSPQDFIRLAYLVNKSVPKVKFILIGDGVLRKKIKRLISKFNLTERVTLTGWRKDISRILSGIDVFVLTSLWEGLPIVILEAMAASLPVIATYTGGIGEVIVEDKSGFLVPPGDMLKMSERLTVLLKDKNLRAQMGQNARDSLDFNFALTNMIRESKNLYEDIMKRKGVIYAN